MKGNGWSILTVAGLTEVVWASAMDHSDGFSDPFYTMLTVVFLTISTILLSRSLKSGLPVGAAYAVWVGIGAVGTTIVSMVTGSEMMSVGRVLLLSLLILGIIGLRIDHKEHGSDDVV